MAVRMLLSEPTLRPFFSSVSFRVSTDISQTLPPSPTVGVISTEQRR
jgi:hypothetical protein